MNDDIDAKLNCLEMSLVSEEKKEASRSDAYKYATKVYL